MPSDFHLRPCTDVLRQPLPICHKDSAPSNKNAPSSATAKQSSSFTIDNLLNKNNFPRSNLPRSFTLNRSHVATDNKIYHCIRAQESCNGTENMSKTLRSSPSRFHVESPLELHLNEPHPTLELGLDRQESKSLVTDTFTGNKSSSNSNSGGRPRDTQSPRFEWLQCTRYRPPKLPRK